jgi:hypothetical protein
LSGGPGLAIFGINKLRDWSPNEFLDHGGAFSVRGGYSFANWQNHSLRVALEITPMFFEGYQIYTEGVNFEWQWF